MMEPPKWLKEIEDESLVATQSSQPTEPESWVHSLSNDHEENVSQPQDSSESPTYIAVESKVENANFVSEIPSVITTLGYSSHDFGSYDQFPVEVSPRISSTARRKSILSGSFSASSGPSPKAYEVSSKNTTFRSPHIEMEMERVRYFPSPLVAFPIVTPFPSEYEQSTVETITEKSLIQSFKGLSLLQSDIHSVSPKQYQEILIQTLEYAINFLLIHPNLTSFFTDYQLVSAVSEEEEEEEQKLYYCDIISSCVLNYLHMEEIALKTTVLLNLLIAGANGAAQILPICDPTLRIREKRIIDLDPDGDTTNKLWRITNSHPCEIIHKIFSIHGLTNHFILDSSLASLCNLSKVIGCREYFTQHSSTPALQILEGYLLSGTRRENSEITCELSSKLFCCYVVDESSQEVWIHAGVYRVLEKIIDRHSQASSSLEWACKSLFCLVQHDTSRDTLLSTEICHLLVNVVLVIRSDLPKEVIRWACLAVGSIAFQHPAASDLFGRLGACTSLCRILEEFGYAEPEIVEVACWALSNLASRQPFNQQVLWKLSVDELLLSFLRLYDRSSAVIRETMITIHSLCYLNEVLYQHLNSHLSSSEGSNGNGEITSPKSPNGQRSSPPRELEFFQSNCPRISKICQIIMQSIEDYEKKRKSFQKSFHFDIEQILPWLWFAVSGISSQLIGRQILRHYGILPSLLLLLKSSGNPLSLRCGFMIFRSYLQDLSLEDLEPLRLLTESLPTSLHRILNSSSSSFSPDSLYVACDLISKLAIHLTLSFAFENAKGCQIVTKILQRYQRDKRMVEIALLAIKNLCQPTTAPTLEIISRFESSSCNLCELLPSVLIAHHCDTFPIALWGCQVLKLLSSSKQSVKKLDNANISHCVLLTFNSHPSISSLPILQEVCDLLWNLCTLSSVPSLLHSLISSGTCEMLMNILIICQDDESNEASSSVVAVVSTMNCILSCLRCIHVLLQRSSDSAELFSKMGCHILLFRIISRYTTPVISEASQRSTTTALLIVSYQILNTLLEGNLFLRKQLLKNDIAIPILNSYAASSLELKSDVTPATQEKLVHLSRCLCLLLSISPSSQNKVQLFVVRELFLEVVKSQLINSLDSLISFHLKFDLGEKPLMGLLNVMTALLECHEIFFPPAAYQPVLCLESSQVFIVYKETSLTLSSSQEEQREEEMKKEREEEREEREMSLIAQIKASKLMQQVMELLPIYLNEDHRIIERSLRVLALFLQHDLSSQNLLDTSGCLCEMSMKILTESSLPLLPVPVILNCLSLIYHMTLFNLRTKLKYLSLSCETVILRHLQQHPNDEELVSLGMLALSSLATGHDMLNTPIYHPIGVMITAQHHLESKKICLASCAVLCSITRNTRDKALALTSYSTSFHSSFLSFKSQLSSILLLSQSLIVSCGKLLSSSGICRAVLYALLNVLLLHSQEVDESGITGHPCPAELQSLLLDTSLLKYLGYIIVRHLSLADICHNVIILLRLVTSFVDTTELSVDFVQWKHFLVVRKDPLCHGILSKCHGIGMNNFVLTILETYSTHQKSADKRRSDSDSQSESESGEIVFSAVTTLAQLSLHQNTKAYLSNPKNEVLGKIIALCHSEREEHLFIAIFQLLSHLCDNDFLCSRYLIDSGLCELLAWSLETYLTSATLVKYVCRCTHLLCAMDPTARGMFHSCHLWIAMSSCLESYLTNGAIAYECCLAIYHLCLSCQDNIQQFATSQVCLSLVNLLQEHELNELICFVSFRLLSVLCPTYYQTLTQLNQVSDLTKFLTSLRHHIPLIAARYPKSDRIILWSNRVLNSVHSDQSSASSSSETNQHLTDRTHPPLPLNRTESETSQMVISNLSTYFSTNSAIVLESIISIANTLAIDPNHFSEINLAEKLKETLVRYADHSSLVIACCKAISFLKSPKHIKDLSSTKLPLHFLEILSRRYHKNAEVMEWGCHAISTMALDRTNRQSLMSCGVCDVVVSTLQIGTGSGDAFVAMVLQKQIGSISLALAACEALHLLGGDSVGETVSSNAERLGSCGACDALIRLFLKYSDSAEVTSAICKSFVTLADHCPENRVRLGGLGACKLILMVLDTHHSHQPAAVWSCRAVEVMSRPLLGTLETKFGANVCPAVIQAMQFHQGDVEVASAGCAALSSLTCYPAFLLPLLQHHVIESLLFSIQLCVFDEETIISASSSLCRLMSPNTYDIFVRYDCISTFLCLLFKYHPHPHTSYPIWFNLYKLSFCSTDCCLQLLTEGILEIYSKVVEYLLEDRREEIISANEEKEKKRLEEEEEEEWSSVLRVMSDVLIMLHDKQFPALQRELSQQERLVEMVEGYEERKKEGRGATGGGEQTLSSRKVLEGVHLIVSYLTPLLPNPLEISGQGAGAQGTDEPQAEGEAGRDGIEEGAEGESMKRDQEEDGDAYEKETVAEEAEDGKEGEGMAPGRKDEEGES
jgi:hypothetical protein